MNRSNVSSALHIGLLVFELSFPCIFFDEVTFAGALTLARGARARAQAGRALGPPVPI